MPKKSRHPHLRPRVAMTTRVRLRRVVAATALALTSLLVLPPVRADAHSLTSSTVSVHVSETAADATLTLPLPALAEALGTTTDDIDTDTAVEYIADHLSVGATDGTEWGDAFHDAKFATVEGIDSFRVDVAFDINGSGTSAFEIEYDAIVETVEGQEAVVVLTDAAGNISTPGVITESAHIVTIGESGSTKNSILDMVHHGMTHVLGGADHLLFLLVLLLPAPLIARSGRWGLSKRPMPTVRQVLHVVTAFTVGHSITLISAGLGLITVSTRPVEILIAVSVAVGAVHAIRPLVRRGEEIIAVAFGLIHGLAFATLLTDLGFERGGAITSLLAFNVGVELAQLLVVALVFPSLYVMSRTRFGPAVRMTGASIALLAATAWGLDRLGASRDPFANLETTLVGHPWTVVALLAAAAGGLALLDPTTTARPAVEAAVPVDEARTKAARTR